MSTSLVRWIPALGLLLFACSTTSIEVVAYHDNGAPKHTVEYEVTEAKKTKVFETIYYPNGQVKMAGAIQGDKRHGVWKTYYESGALWSEGEYTEGLRIGSSVVYHENGFVHIEGRYENDEASGRWKFYSDQGVLEKEIDYNEVD
jgi:antitoxin component YwqK of YwqJK toxin-antitoxin module